jgi:peptide/nickel transport system permease protein
VAVGALAAIGGPVLDTVLMRLVDALLAFPRLFLLLALAALFRPSNWRAELRGLEARGFIAAVRALGLSRRRILLHHQLPNSLAPVLPAAALLVGGVLTSESALSFLGLGVQPPASPSPWRWPAST